MFNKRTQAEAKFQMEDAQGTHPMETQGDKSSGSPSSEGDEDPVGRRKRTIMPGSTALHQACRVGDRQWIELLLEPEARAKRRASYEAVRLYGAKRSEQDRVVRKKAKRASRDRRSLVRAKEAKMREQAMLLEELGRDRKDKLIRKIVNSALIELITAEEATEGQTPFHLACEFGHIDIVRYLASILRKSFVIPFVLPFVINYTDYRGWTPLHCAASMGHLDICQVLLDAHADASALADISNTSALHMLLRCESLLQEPLFKIKDVIEGMLRNGASINGQNAYGETALHFACWKGNARAVSILIKNGAHVHVVNKRQETCLHYATRQGNVKIIELLVKHGADINALGDCGTAADVARSHHQDHIASFMDSFLTLRSLPDELLVKVLGFLDAEDLTAVGLVSKKFYQITDDSPMWRRAYVELVPHQLALSRSECDDFKTECKKWLRLRMSSEWYREARKEGRWRFDCPRNDEDWVYDRFFRVALVGDVGTGKRSFLTRFVDDAYMGSRTLRKSMTKTKAIHHNNKTIKLQMLSASGFHYEGRESCDLKSIKGALLFFDVSDAQSFQNLSFWCQHLQRLAPPDIPVVVVATKVDLVHAPAVSYSHAKQWCEMRAFPLLSVSSRKALNVDTAMRHLVKRLMSKEQEERGGTASCSSPSGSTVGTRVPSGLRVSGKHKGSSIASPSSSSSTSTSNTSGQSGGDGFSSGSSGDHDEKGRRTSESRRMAKSAGEAMKAAKRDRRKEVKRAATDGSMRYHRRPSPDSLDRQDDGDQQQMQQQHQKRVEERRESHAALRQSSAVSTKLEERRRDEEEGLFNSGDIIIPSLTAGPPKKKGIKFWKRH